MFGTTWKLKESRPRVNYKSDNQLRRELGLPEPTPAQLEKRRLKNLMSLSPGHAVGNDNKLHPIPGALSEYDPTMGKFVVGVRLKEHQPQWKKLVPVSIDSLGDDGNVMDDVRELGLREPTSVVAGEDVDDDPETEKFERVADSALLPEVEEDLDAPVDEGDDNAE
jgi:hypothetical protein